MYCDFEAVFSCLAPHYYLARFLLYHPSLSLSLSFSCMLFLLFPIHLSPIFFAATLFPLSPPPSLPLIVQLLVTKGLPLPKEATKYFKYFSLNKYILTYSDFLIIYSKIKTNSFLKWPLEGKKLYKISEINKC